MLFSFKTMIKKEIKMILTVPPLAKFKNIAENPLVESIRLNTTLPLESPLEDILSNVRSEAGTKPVWIDLKTRQLRIASYDIRFLKDKEIHSINLSHKIKLDIPSDIFIDNANYIGQAIDLVHDKILIIESSVEKRKGIPLPEQGQVGIRPGMSVNIINPSLIIDGYLTEKDKKYIEAGKKLGMNNFMLSFVEQESDIADLLDINPKANIIAKIESKKGLEFVDTIYSKYNGKINLMAARGDLYTELDRPDNIIDACKKIIKANPKAIFASRMLESLVNLDEIPRCAELFDVYCGMLMGYKRFLVGDDICSKKDSANAALGLFKTLKEKYQPTQIHSTGGIFLSGKSTGK
jgi:hypothetical protein